MKYLCLIYGAPEVPGEATGLRPAAEATTVRIRDGEVRVTSGPFTETTDELAAFQVLDCEAIDEALSRATGLRAAAVEVRPEYVETTP